ncbi:uncharacterized protein LOC134188991 [Corticium candelabrum]|uniref:uncharacterized protein LOC134188991 n=1 Tax=Corticium candelabrum TaxID=121492 RepID=UPI002E25D589|nr:uncharacterized protein LOC134188991 [Corticium candelabrum]
MLNQSNPKQGVEIDYGTTSCCPQLNGYPGIVGRLDVKMIVRPSIDCHTHTNFWSVESIDLPYPQLTDCSPAQNGEFRVELRTSQLCPDQIVWRLSQQHTHFVCSTLNHNTIRCTLTPKLVFDNKSVSTMSAICSRLVLMIRYVNGTNCSMTSQFKEENDVCVVSVAVGNSLVQNIDVIDIDGSVVGQVNAPRFHSPSQSMKVLGVCLAIAECVLILILLLKVATVRCRKRERVKLDEMRSACENTFLLQPPRRYEEKSRGTNDTPTVATSV